MSSQSWWSLRRREFELAQEQRRLRAAVRRQKRKVKAEERRRKRELSARHSWFRQASQRFSLWRRLQAEKRLSARARWRERSALYRWVERRQGLVIGSVFLLLVGVFCVFLFREAYAPKRRVAPGYGDEAAVTVNGKKITMARYIKSLEVAYGPGMLQELTEQEVVKQEAQRLKIELSPEERAKIQDSLAKDPQYAVRFPQIEKGIFLRKIILRQTPDARLREVYDLFKDDLIVYVLEQLQFADEGKAQAFQSAITGGATLAQAEKTFAKPGSQRLALDGFTLGSIRERFGPAAAEALVTAKKGSLTKPIANGRDYMVYRVKDIRSSFEAAKPAVEAIVVEAETAKVLHQLLSAASIDSFYLERNLLKNGKGAK